MYSFIIKMHKFPSQVKAIISHYNNLLNQPLKRQLPAHIMAFTSHWSHKLRNFINWCQYSYPTINWKRPFLARLTTSSWSARAETKRSNGSSASSAVCPPTAIWRKKRPMSANWNTPLFLSRTAKHRSSYMKSFPMPVSLTCILFTITRLQTKLKRSPSIGTALTRRCWTFWTRSVNDPISIWFQI